MQVLADRSADRLMREPDEHVYGIYSQVPGLDNRDSGREESSPAVGGMHHAGQDDAYWASTDDGVNQCVLTRSLVAALPKQKLVSALVERIGQRLNHVLKNRSRHG